MKTKNIDTQFIHGIVIDKNIECPPVNMTSPWTFLAYKMQVGDSVEVRSSDHLDKIKNAIIRLGYYPIRRKMGEGVYRIWKMGKKGTRAKRKVADWVRYAKRDVTFIAASDSKGKASDK